MTIFFTADQHFGHHAIMKHCDRPFQNTQEMDREIITRFNSVVGPKDEVWHLGDFFWKGGAKQAVELVKKLNGRRHHFIMGNHDKWMRSTKNNPELLKILKNHRIFIYENLHELRHDGKRIYLCHYPLASWPASFHGAWMLHGHCHGRHRRAVGCIADVGVDCHDFFPVSYEKLKEFMDQRPMPQEERSHYCIPVKHLNNLLNMWDDNKLILKDENDEDWNSLVEAMTDIGGILDEK